MIQASQIPEYVQAVRKERACRDAAFLGITETVGSFELRAMTLRDYIMLRNMRSPVLARIPATEEQLSAFLWLLSPAFQPGWQFTSWLLRRAFILFRCRRLWKDDLFMAKTEAACWAYVDETFQDSKSGTAVGWIRPPNNPLKLPPIPAPQTPRNSDPEYFSDACYFSALFARHYNGWTPEMVLNLPLKAVFQFQNEIRKQCGIDLQNPSDAVLSNALLANRQN